MKPLVLVAALLAALLAALPAGCAAPRAESARQRPLLVFLVRHAEKSDGGSDPELTAAGRRRAEELARVLGDAGIGQVHSTDYARTCDTAAPLALDHGLTLAMYGPGDLPALAARLRAAGGRHLVVGHSNTTPEMVRLLGGDPGPPIDEATEFDRLYVVSVARDGAATSALVRYGAPPRTGP